MLKITKTNYKNLVFGSAFFSTGGGFLAIEQTKRLEKITKVQGEIIIRNLEELNDDDSICTVYEVAQASDPIKHDITDLVIKVKNTLKKLNIRISGLFLGEVGVESLCFDVAIQMGLEIIDADCTGGRAVPSMEIDNTFLYRKTPFLPAIAISYSGKVKVFSSARNLSRNIDEFYFKVNEPVIVFDHLMNIKTAKKILTSGSVLRNIQFGEALLHNMDFAKTIKKLTSFSGTIEKIDKIDDARYDRKIVHIKSENGMYKLLICNEYLGLILGHKVVTKCPDFISLLDEDLQTPIHSTELKTGQTVNVFSFQAERRWQTKKGKEIFNLDKFFLPLP